MPHCQNCKAHVTDLYVRVRTHRDEDEPQVCPHCPDKVRDHRGRARDARSDRGKDDGGSVNENEYDREAVADGGVEW